MMGYVSDSIFSHFVIFSWNKPVLYTKEKVSSSRTQDCAFCEVETRDHLISRRAHNHSAVFELIWARSARKHAIVSSVLSIFVARVNAIQHEYIATHRIAIRM